MEFFTLNKRLKKLMTRGVCISIKEADTARKLSKFCEKFLINQEFVFEEMKKFNEIHESNEQKQELLQYGEKKYFDLKKQLKFQSEVIAKMRAQIDSQEENSEEKNTDTCSFNFDVISFWLLKSATKVYVKNDLPNSIQGFIVHVGCGGTRFYSFRLNPEKNDLQEVPDVIWSQIKEQTNEWQQVFDQDKSKKSINS